jgi:hypothetical protein
LIIITSQETDKLDAPIRVVGEKTVNTPERLAAELQYEKFLGGKFFIID